MENKFDDIRPYYDEEIPAAMQRIAENEVFPLLAAFVYPNDETEAVRQRITSFKTIKEFQCDTMYKLNEQIIARSMTNFTCSGLERLNPNDSHLYVSNHRDIVLDACLLQYFFVKNGFDTTEITFGANLMRPDVVVDIGKSNKMFKVERPGGSMIQFYRSSLHLSQYIRHTITQKHQSVWIAQRNGRTKNGIDSTDQGIIKMFCMSESTDSVKALDDLKIVPIAVSYEWEPCDSFKAVEVLKSMSQNYVKEPGEDLNSIISGILQPKGCVHFELCEPITTAELQSLANLTSVEYHKSVAQLLDRRINAAYKLYPNNFIAHDLLYNDTRFSDRYTADQLQEFKQYMARQLQSCGEYNTPKLKEIFLGIYANPINNKNLI
ncbi:MAG: acyltransferase [Muribaculaceae bacterium]|nr:acyltransferase [Muribaculaceae bacterium]